MTSPLVQAIDRRVGPSRSRRTAVVSVINGAEVQVDIGGVNVIVDGVLDGYSPTVGDTVILSREDSSWLLLGRPTGTGDPATIRGYLGASHATGFSGSLVTQAGAGEVAMASWVTTSFFFTFEPGRLFAIEAQCGVYNSTAGNGLSNIRVRKGVGNTTGLVVTTWRPPSPGSSQVATTSYTGYAKNITSAAIITELGLTLERVLANGTHGLFADSAIGIPAILTVRDIGSVASNASLAAAATALT